MRAVWKNSDDKKIKNAYPRYRNLYKQNIDEEIKHDVNRGVSYCMSYFCFAVSITSLLLIRNLDLILQKLS